MRIEIEMRNGIFRIFLFLFECGNRASSRATAKRQQVSCNTFLRTSTLARGGRPVLASLWLSTTPRNVEGSSLRGGRAAGERDFAAAASATPAAAAGYRLLW